MINPEIIHIKEKLLFSIAYKTTVSYLKLARKYLKLLQEDIRNISNISENHLVLFESGFEIIKKINNFTTIDWVFDCLNFYLEFAYFCKKEQNFNYAFQKISIFLSKVNTDLIITNFNISFSGAEKLFFLTAEFAKKCKNLDQSLFYAKESYAIARNCIENKLFYKRFLDLYEKSEKILGEKNLFLGYVEKFLAELLIFKKDLKEAVSYFEKAYFRFEKELGGNATLTEKIYGKIKDMKSKLEMENIIDGMNLKSAISPSNKSKGASSLLEDRHSPFNANNSDYSKQNEMKKIITYFMNPKLTAKNLDSMQIQTQNKSTGLTNNKSEDDSKVFFLSRYIGASKKFLTNSKISLTDRRIKKNLNQQYNLDEGSITNRDLSSFKKSFILSSRPKINVIFEKEKKKKNEVQNFILENDQKNNNKKQPIFSLFGKKENSHKALCYENKNAPYLQNSGSLPFKQFEFKYNTEAEKNENQAEIKNKKLKDFQNINFSLSTFQKSKINLWKNRIQTEKYRQNNQSGSSPYNYEEEERKFRKEECAKKIQKFFRYWIDYKKNGVVPVLFKNGTLIMPDFENDDEFKTETNIPKKTNSPHSPFHRLGTFQKVIFDFFSLFGIHF